MCHYITALLSPDADSSRVRQFAKTHLLKWELMQKHSLKSTLREGETYYRTTRGTCDCGTGVGILHDDERPEPNFERKAKKLKKKGWSGHKIERWIEDKRRDMEKAKDRNTHYLSNPPIDVVHWMGFISDVLDAKAASYLGLLKHWYDGLIETERINVFDRRWIPYKKLDHEYLLRAEEDVIHTFSLHEYAKLRT
jgi:hypothetical protein